MRPVSRVCAWRHRSVKHHSDLDKVLFFMGVRVNSASSERGFSAECGFKGKLRASLGPQTTKALQQAKIILSDIKMNNAQRSPSGLGSISKDARETLFHRRGNADPGNAAGAAAAQAQAQRGGGGAAAAAAAAAAVQGDDDDAQGGGGGDDEVQIELSREDIEEEEEKKMSEDLRYAAMGIVITCSYLLYDLRALKLPTLEEAQDYYCCLCDALISEHGFSYARDDGRFPAIYCSQCNSVYHPGCASIDEGSSKVVAMMDCKREAKLHKHRCPKCAQTTSSAHQLFWWKASDVVPYVEDLRAGDSDVEDDNDDDNEGEEAEEAEEDAEYDAFA